MHERPDGVTDGEVLAVVRDQWLPSVERVEHLPVGFGAHHWAAYVDGRPRLFVTLDPLSPGGHHDAQTLEATYAAAAALSQRLPFVVACEPTATGSRTVSIATGAVSVTEWAAGARPKSVLGAGPLVRELHVATPPAEIVSWAPLVPDSFAAELLDRLDRSWEAGPLGGTARSALLAHGTAIRGWTAAYHRLAGVARHRRWVPTHGEPHERNQLITDDGLRLVDWESLRLAPAERDLRWLLAAGASADADPDMLELFELEWRLDEVSQHAARFERPHGDGADDHEALGGLLEQLAP